MLRCNLAILLAERNLKITKVSHDTGISRTTLTALVNNRSTGIQLDTLNALCLYLGVKPDEFLSFIPVEIKPFHIGESRNMITADHMNKVRYNEKIALQCSTGWGGNIVICPFDASIEATLESHNEDNADYLFVNMDLCFPRVNDVREKTAIEYFSQLFDRIPRSFLQDVEKEIGFSHSAISVPILELPHKYGVKKINYRISWPSELVDIVTHY